NLPHKEKLKSLNLFGNEIQESMNLSGNPLKAKNLDNLSNEQFAKLVNGIKEKKIRINSYKGTILMDLLEYAQKLASQGNQQQQQNAQYLQALIQSGSPVKTDNKQSGNNAPPLIGGLVIFGIVAVVVGYLLETLNLMKKELKNQKQFTFPPEKELQKVMKRFSDPNYDQVNIGLMPNASELDKTKYEICQSISRYKRVNKLTPSELAKKIKISKEKLDHILFGRITNFNLDELEFRASKKPKIKENLNNWLLDKKVIKDFVQQLDKKEPEEEGIDKV
ncbi:4855_t:CDS:2, partial [Cetraspora pellucida]